jgi:glycosyltransferase involved in cell wall biosynthesis
MRIALCITALGIGGAEIQVVRTADRLAAQGHRVLVLNLSGLQEVGPERSDVPVVALGLGKNPATWARAFAAARRIIGEFAPDVVHSHLFHANLFCRALRLMVPMRRLVCSAHNANEAGTLRRIAYRCTDPLGDLFTNVSRSALADSLAGGTAPASKARVLYNGIPVERFRMAAGARANERSKTRAGLPPETFLFLAAGRLILQKDHASLIEAFARIAERRPAARLWIAGDGPLRGALEDQRRRLGVEDSVRFLGFSSDMPALLAASDAFVLSSEWEGFALVVAEAMAARCLVVATDCGGAAEVAGDAALIVPPRDPDRLRAAMENTMDLSADERGALLDAAESRVERLFSIDASADAWMEAYNSGGTA